LNRLHKRGKWLDQARAFALERHSGLNMPLKLTRQESRSQSWSYAYVL
jgi:hypothetical protein